MTETLGNFINRRFHEEAIHHPGKWVSFADMAKKIGFKQSTFSTWVNDSKVPADLRSIDKLASAIGPEVWDILGLPRPMPGEKRIKLINTVWHKLPPELQDEWYEIAKPYAENGGDDRLKRATN